MEGKARGIGRILVVCRILLDLMIVLILFVNESRQFPNVRLNFMK